MYYILSYQEISTLSLSQRFLTVLLKKMQVSKIIHQYKSQSIVFIIYFINISMRNNTKQSLMQSDTENQTIISSDTQTLLEIKQSRTFFQRAFSKLGQGSLRSAIFAMMASAMGTGLFNFPYIAQHVGLIPLICFIIIGAVFSVGSMYLLMSIALPQKIKTYNQLAELAYGKWLKRLSEICIIFYSWGITVCFQVVFAKFVLQILHFFFHLNVYSNQKTQQLNELGNIIRLCTNAANILLNFLFIFRKNLYSLRYVTILGTFSVFYNALVIFITTFTGFSYVQQGTQYNIYSILSKDHDFSELKLFDFSRPILIMTGIASTVFCYVNHQMIFPISQALNNPTQKRMHKIFNRAHIAQSIVYTIVGVFGYLLLSSVQIQAVVLQSIPTIYMTIGKMLMLITLFFAVPLNLLPSRQMLFDAFNIQRNQRNHIIVCLSLALVGCGIAMSFQKVNSYFGLLGGTAGTLMSGTIPALIYLKLTKRSLSQPRCILVIVFYSIMTICGFVGAIASVIIT